jgi:hypothetical protein
MSQEPTHDPTSIGNILLAMGAVTEEQLRATLKEQRRLREDQMLGKLLVASGIVSTSQLERAMETQRVMRSKKKVNAAMAVADVAIARHRRDSIIATRERIQNCSLQIVRETKRITGSEHPAVSSAMLAKAHGED